MFSRVAENLYWLGRHLERAENVARMARADHEASLESRRLTTTASAWDGLLSATVALRRPTPRPTRPTRRCLSPTS